jgi:hypothetical protein
MVSTGQSRLAGLALGLDKYVVETLKEVVAHANQNFPGLLLYCCPTTHVSEPFTCFLPYPDSAVTL